MAKRTPRVGRPSLPQSRKRVAALLLKLRPDEQAAYRRAAERASLPLAVWARGALDRAASRSGA